METKANRTLVKSAPELWELADDITRLESWMAGVTGGEAPTAVEVTVRELERVLTWRSASSPPARIELELTEKGFGTSVEITAEHDGEPGGTEAALERLLDELGSPERRPFSGA